MIEYQWTHRVEWGECDPAQIVFYPNIYRWFDKGSHDMMSHHGFGQADMIKKYGIVGFPLIETHARFIRPTKWGDRLNIISRVDKYSSKTFTVQHVVFHAGKECVNGYEVRFWGKLDSEFGGNLKVWTMPEDFVKCLS